MKAQEGHQWEQESCLELCTDCKQAKWTLSSNTQASTESDHLYEGIEIYNSITKAQFEELDADLICGELDSVEKDLWDAI